MLDNIENIVIMELTVFVLKNRGIQIAPKAVLIWLAVMLPKLLISEDWVLAGKKLLLVHNRPISSCINLT